VSGERRNISSGSPYEAPIGFSRAVRVGPWLAVGGTAPLDVDGRTACPGDVYGQTRRCLEIALAAMAEAGGRPADVIRSRVLLTEMSRWRDAARAHGEVFGEIRPATTFVEVSGFIDTEWLVEVELDAVVTG
jgi:enamine deaminase RidA (YjgF/YER057c/UK114 family)